LGCGYPPRIIVLGTWGRGGYPKPHPEFRVVFGVGDAGDCAHRGIGDDADALFPL